LNDRGERGLGRHVEIDLSEARLERLWSGIAARLPRREPARRAWVLVAAAGFAGAAAAILVVRQREAAPGGLEVAAVTAPAEAGALRLPDGSSLATEPGTRVDTSAPDPLHIRLTLAHGRIRCDVTHRPGRSFVVLAGGVEVRVVGTRFSVAREESPAGPRVDVEVERGVVEVRPSGLSQTVRVEAGHSWSSATQSELTEQPTAPPIAPPAPTPAPPAPATRPARPAAVASPRTTAARPAPAADARALFEEARGLWRDGRIAEAADRYQALLTQFPRDARAGLAAFELGRLRMDRLRDPSGAVQALERAVALVPGAELREDALARLVAAEAAAGDPAGCARARQRYLGAYPGGVHRGAVAAACGAR
jgi:transmembrane sensor